MKPADVKGRGVIVQTGTGKIGRTMHGDNPINCKVPVYLFKPGSYDLDENEKGEVVKILCSAQKLKPQGFID